MIRLRTKDLGGVPCESKTVGKTDLRKMQGHPPQRQRDGHL